MWNGGTQINPNWAVKTELPGGETLYTTPDPATTTTNPSIGIVDGNLISLPTSYNTLNVDTLNSVSINNSGNINTATINGHSADASAWSTFPAIQDVAMANYSLNNANTLNANSSVNIGTLTTGGSLNVGQYDANPTSAPSVTIGNPALNKCSVDIYGANNTVGFGAMTVNGGFTVGAGTLHGVKMTCDSAVSLDAVRFNMDAVNGISLLTLNPAQPIQNISLDSIKQIKTRSVLGTIVASQTGLYVTQLATSGYDGGRVFTDKISPGYNGTNPLTINGNVGLTGSTKTGVIIEDGINISSDNFNGKSLYYLNKAIQYPLPYDYGTSYDRGALVTYTDGISYWSNGNFNAGHLPDSSPTWWYAANYVSGRTYYDPQNAILNNIVYKCTSTIGTTVPPPNATYWIVASTTTIGKWDFGFHKQGLRFNSLFSNVFNTLVQKEGSAVPSWITTTEFDNTFTDTASSNFVLSPAMESLNMGGYDINTCNTLAATTVSATTIGATTVNAINGNFTNITATGTAVIPYLNPTLITLPEASFSPKLWNDYTTYPQYAFVYYPDPLTLWFSILADMGTPPGTDPTTWIAAGWDEGATYDIGMPAMDNLDPSLGMFWISTTNGNVGNEPSTSPSNWITTTNYTLGYINAGITFTKSGAETTQTYIGRRVGAALPMDVTISAVDNTNYEISAGTIVTSPAYKDLDMNYKNLTNLSQVLNDGDFHMITNGTIGFNTGTGRYADLNFVTGHSLQCFAGNTNGGGTDGNGDLKFLCGAQIEFGSYNGGSISFHTFGSTNGDVTVTQDITFEAQRDISVTTDSRDIIIHSARDLSLYGGRSCIYNSGGSTTFGTGTTLTANTGGAITLNPTSGGTTITSALNMSNQTITSCAGLSRAGTMTLTTTTGSNNITLSPSGIVLSNKNIDLNNNSLINCASVTRAGILALTGSTGLNATATTGTAYLTAAAGATIVTGYTNASLIATTGDTFLRANAGVLDLYGNGNCVYNSGGSTTIGTGTTLVMNTGGNITLNPTATSGIVSVTKNLDMNGKDIVNLGDIYGKAGANLHIYPDPAYSLQIGGLMNMLHNSIINCPVLSSFGGDNLAVTSANALTLNATAGNITLTPSGNVVSNSTLDMTSHGVINCATLNTHNLYCYASFYSSASQTLGASNTPTRVKMDATGSASGITLDSVTNIGRITFAKAGTYSVSWDAYFVHGIGGSTVTNVWIRKNGTDVVASNRTILNNSTSNEAVLSSVSFVDVTASQYIEFFWAADGTNVPLTFVAAATTPYAKPSTPGFTCAINIVA